ncbi:hypothetical protein [Microbacterium sp. SS28]|uniref:hypothetical protein n=1 Tax=Microbacterium sp. SS28 TaxID=2919948 RepID=UPI001FAA628B|nr:hypothetical protein [Microbacterium sp. SS28]
MKHSIAALRDTVEQLRGLAAEAVGGGAMRGASDTDLADATVLIGELGGPHRPADMNR